MNESRAAFESESLDRYSDLEVDAIELNNIKGTPSEVANVIATEIIQEVTREAATMRIPAIDHGAAGCRIVEFAARRLGWI
jgi:hypothetical protein